MKNFTMDKRVDEQKELKYMKDYALSIWDGESSIINSIIEEGFNLGLQTKTVENIKFYEHFIELSDKRKQLLKSVSGDNFSYYYDGIFNIYNNLFQNSNSYNDSIRELIYDKMTKLYAKPFIKQFESTEKIKPKGWEDVKKSKKDVHEYFRDFSLKDEKLFKGYNSDSAGAPGFHARINLAHIYYSENEQSHSALENLFGSAWAHGIAVKSHNNMYDAFASVKEFFAYFNDFKDEKFNKPIYINFDSFFNNQIANALMVPKYSDLKIKSQKELDEQTKKSNEANETYGVCSLSFLGNDDYQHEYTFITKIFSEENFKEKVKQHIENTFSNQNEFEISVGNSSSLVNKNKILESLVFDKINKKEFDALSLVYPSNNNTITIGKNLDFIQYNYPSQKEIEEINAEFSRKLMKELLTKEKPSAKNEKSQNKEKVLTYEQKCVIALNAPITKDNFKNLNIDYEKDKEPIITQKYAIASLYISDKYYNYESLYVSKVKNLNDFENQISNQIEEFFENQENKELFYSDNQFIIIDKNKIQSSIQFSEISHETFEILSKITKNNSSNFTIGHHTSFIKYLEKIKNNNRIK